MVSRAAHFTLDGTSLGCLDGISEYALDSGIF